MDRLIELRLQLENEVNEVFFTDEKGDLYPYTKGYDASDDNLQTIEAKLKVLNLAEGRGAEKRRTLTEDDIKFIFDIPSDVEEYEIG